MDIRESLTVRTVTALQRLADLEERGRTVTGPKAGILKSALRELESALHELRVASEQLNVMVDEIAEARSNAAQLEEDFDHFRRLLPVACLLTDRAGHILDANPAAGEMLNVTPRHLVGKPLSLFIVDRDHFFTIVNGLRFSTGTLKTDLAVRPRERKPRKLTVELAPHGRADQLYWFFHNDAAAFATMTADSERR